MRPKNAFTLVEVLVVIAIITVLMGLLFSIAGPIRDKSNRAKAQLDLLNLIGALKSYHNEYGQYPVASGSADAITGVSDDNSIVIDVLRNNSGGSNAALVAALNTRHVVYLSANIVKDDAAPKSGVTSNAAPHKGCWFDPWGRQYCLALDGDYDGELNTGAKPLPGFYSDPRFSPLVEETIAWSYGKDKAAGKNGNNVYQDSDDVISWQ